MKRQFALMTVLSLMTAGMAAAPAQADDDDDNRYEDRWDDDDRWDRDRDWDDDDDRWDRDRRDRWDGDDRWRDDRWDRGRHNGWRDRDRYDRYGRYGVTRHQAAAIAHYRGMRRISEIDFDDGRWKIEGWGRRGEMEIEISARTARILDIDYD